MIPELGHYALLLALLTSLLQSGLNFRGAHSNDVLLMRAGRRATLVSFGLVLASFAALTAAHVTDDFSVLNVAQNSHTLKPLLYKFTGVWGSHEGSMLLWVLILTGYGAAMALFLRNLPTALTARALGVQGLLGIGFLAFSLFTSNPFARFWPAPLEGHDLNPLLQDPGLAFHPPLLYLGYVGFSSVFALAAAQLLTGGAMVPWAKWTRPWALVAWSFLTLGIALGSWWAYYELGWGGWWFWDPVENAALLPWLAGTALLHSLLASWQRSAFNRWTLLLAILAFSLSLLGTFLVRSGVLTSVHSFASDPTRGVFIIALLTLAIGGALTLYAFKAETIPGSPMFGALSRETAILLNNALLITACASVLLGTLYPMLLDALGDTIVSVGAPYFNLTALPILALLALLMAAGPSLQWRHNETGNIVKSLRVAFVLALLATSILAYQQGVKNILGLLGGFTGVWLLTATLATAIKTRQIKGMVLAHGGLALAILGMAGSAFSATTTLTLRLNESAPSGKLQISYTALNPIKGPNYEGEQGTFLIKNKGELIAEVKPERRYYPSQGMVLSHVAIKTNLLRNIFVAMSDDGDQAILSQSTQRTLRIQIEPLVPLIWIGGGVMALGGLTAAWQRRRKFGESPP